MIGIIVKKNKKRTFYKIKLQLVNIKVCMS